MTNEEAISYIRDILAENNSIKPSMVVFELEKEALYMAIKALEQTRWIPVSERLPKVADCYDVTRQSGSDLIVSTCYFDGINWHNGNWINHERNYLTDVVAWMPRLEPYKAESYA